MSDENNNVDKPYLFQPGCDGGPGRPKIPKNIIKSRKILTEDFQKIGHAMWNMTMSEVAKIAAQDNSSLGGASIIANLFVGARNQDIQCFRELLNRLVGKPITQIELSGKDGGSITFAQAAKSIADYGVKQVEGGEDENDSSD